MLVVDRVQRSFGPVAAVRNVSFQCERGGVVGLLGPNGAGKTTTMRMILGIYPPDSGSVTWNGKPIDRIVRKRFGYLPEERGLYAKMKVREQIAYFGRLHGMQEFDALKRADVWLARLDIEQYAKRPSGELSKGNQQKVQLACAVLHEPELLVLDEPFSGLDPVNAQIMLDCITLLRDEGTTFVLSSHQMWQIEYACNSFCIIGAAKCAPPARWPNCAARSPPERCACCPICPRFVPCSPSAASASRTTTPTARCAMSCGEHGFRRPLARRGCGGPARVVRSRGTVAESNLRPRPGRRAFRRARRMNEVGLVFTVEFMRKVRSRVFLIATFAGVLSIVALVLIPAFITHAAKSSSDTIVLAGPEPLRARAASLLQKHHDFRVVYQAERLPQPMTVGFLDDHEKAAAAVVVSEHAKRLHLDVYPRDAAVFDEVQFRSLVPLNVELATGASAAETENVAKIERSLHPLEKRFADAKSATFAHGVAFGMVFILYLAIIIASQSVMSAVAEEKTSRIAEILIATISPANLLAGKVLAAAVIAIVQVGCWLATAAVLVPFAASSQLFTSTPLGPGGATPAALGIDPLLALYFIAFFILGYLQYATVYAAAASLISRTEDLGSVTTPVILPVVGAFFVAQYALVEPNAPLVVICSFVPFLSPFVMFTRVAISVVPWWQIVLAERSARVARPKSSASAGRVRRANRRRRG
jgi:ABC-type Na+ transport system ATPase subunit NatA/ABC-type Na+ efflux pump permease subunit